MTGSDYHVDAADLSEIPSPAMLVFQEHLENNLDWLLATAGSPDLLRPHCKTHKTREIVRMLVDRGVRRHKCATLREAAMCVEAGAPDVLLAYQLVGPAVGQFADLAAEHPDVRLAALVDCEGAAEQLSAAAVARGVTVGAMVDLDTGGHRTGLPPGEQAVRLYRRVASLPGLRPAGLHTYDSHNFVTDPVARRAGVERTLETLTETAESVRRAGLEVPEICCGGSGTFPLYVALSSAVVSSPGTTVFWDRGYQRRYPDVGAHLKLAALVLGRVISRPTPQYVTLDVGNKAIAADPPQGQRGVIRGLEDAQTVLHNEEHWTVSSERAGEYRVGDSVLIEPTHVCPCSNLHPVLYVIGPDGRLAGRWEVAARQRALRL